MSELSGERREFDPDDFINKLKTLSPGHCDDQGVLRPGDIVEEMNNKAMALLLGKRRLTEVNRLEEGIAASRSLFPGREEEFNELLRKIKVLEED